MSWLSLPEYSRLTGTPESSVRALIKAGKLEAHREARAPGDPREVWKIMVDDPPAPPTEHPQPPAASEAQQPQPATTEPPALTTSLLEMVKADRATIATLYAENADLREERGRLQAERDAAAARAQAAEAAEAELRRERGRTWWDRLLGR